MPVIRCANPKCGKRFLESETVGDPRVTENCCSVECAAELFPDSGGGREIDTAALEHELSIRTNIHDYLESK